MEILSQRDVTVPPALGSDNEKMPRFTLDGSAALEAHLSRSCQQVLAGVQQIVPSKQLQALLLGGGYGRGEGGVLQTQEGERPYNDLEFYLCLKGGAWRNQRRYGVALHALGERLSAAAGVEVEFKIISLEKLRRSARSMFYYDLIMGHRWLFGGEELLAGCEHHRTGEQIPLSEATRLLMNRCTGLLFGQEKLESSPLSAVEADFIARNQAKAQLAFGDAVLTVRGQYHWSCRVRHERLLKLQEDWAWLRVVQQHHAQGLAFKLHPQRSSVARSLLQQQQLELVGLGLQLWLWVESRRLGHPFNSAREYGLSHMDKCPEMPSWRNCLVNLSVFGPCHAWRLRLGRYPRERLCHALTLLLWEPETFREPMLLRRLQNELRSPESTFPGLVRVYQSLWRRFN